MICESQWKMPSGCDTVSSVNMNPPKEDFSYGRA